LSLRKIIKIGTTRCQILTLKCTKFDFRWGQLYLGGPTSKGREGKGGGKRKGRGEEEKGSGGGLEGPSISCWHRAPRRVRSGTDQKLITSTGSALPLVDTQAGVRGLSCGKMDTQTHTPTHTHTHGDHNTCSASMQRRAGKELLKWLRLSKL